MAPLKYHVGFAIGFFPRNRGLLINLLVLPCTGHIFSPLADLFIRSVPRPILEVEFESNLQQDLTLQSHWRWWKTEIMIKAYTSRTWWRSSLQILDAHTHIEIVVTFSVLNFLNCLVVTRSHELRIAQKIMQTNPTGLPKLFQQPRNRNSSQEVEKN